MENELKPEELCDCPTWADFCPLQPKSSPMKRSRCWRCRLKVKAQLAKDTEVCPDCVNGMISEAGRGSDGFEKCPTCNGSGRVAKEPDREKRGAVLKIWCGYPCTKVFDCLGPDAPHCGNVDKADQIIALKEGEK